MLSRMLTQLVHFRAPIRITVVTIFILTTTLTVSVAVGLQYYFTKQIASDATLAQFTNLTNQSIQYLKSIDREASNATRVLANYPALAKKETNPTEVNLLFSEIMKNNPLFYAIYIGYDNGDFYMVINLDSSPIVRQQLKALPEDRWIVISILNQRIRQSQSQFYDADFNLRTTRTERSKFDATQRPWFKQARQGRVTKTKPYLFHNLQAPGQTYSMNIERSPSVIGVDIALSSLSHFFEANKVDQNSTVFLYQKSGEIIATNAHSSSDILATNAEPLALTLDEQVLVDEYPLLNVANENNWAPIDYTIAGKPKGFSIDYLKTLSTMLGIEFNFINGFTWPQLVEQFKNGDIDVLQPVYKNKTNQQMGTFSDPFIDLPYFLVTTEDKSDITHISQITDWTIAIPKGWSIIEVLQQHFPEIKIQQVASTAEVLKNVQQGNVDAGLDSGLILKYNAKQYFIDDLKFHEKLDFSPVQFPDQLHLMIAKNKPELINLFNKAITHFDPEVYQALERKWLQPNNHAIETTTIPYHELIKTAHQPRDFQKLLPLSIDNIPHFFFVSPISKDINNDEFLGIIIPVEDVLGDAMDKVMLSILFTLGTLTILSPLLWLAASPIVEPIKKLADENEKIKQRHYNQVNKPNSRIKEIDDLGQSMLDMSLAIEQFDKDQKALMDSFIRLIAEAIDDKSPYTAGHCERVPILAFMLAEKAEHMESGAFKQFAFHSQEEWREFKIGAWLHDCGKITTPEHIVDKGSKLETIYNRIHEIRTRFEVLLRDAEITYWQHMSTHPEQAETLTIQLDQTRQKIHDDFEFIAKTNVGGEYLSEDKKIRVKEIAEQTWVRHLDDRLGLSPLEETRLVSEPVTLPTRENLLFDKAEHLIPRDNSVDYDPKLGIKMKVPHYLYNQGEIYNLLVERGTLTAEDRFKINEHIIGTIKMLENLPLPPELSKVPQYASTHHETMKGTGYPRQLSAEDLSIPERIMVLADIYEALTAADRPYKKAKPISVAINILHKMMLDEHIDKEVFELFLTSGVYLDYAQQFLAESQIDDVDITQYLSSKNNV
jgi:HD-GYP domain-containing protein (c-di-GMP phosphodiesterase class II)/ABC-type amino acid transport substrate-binding protein